MDLDTGYFSLLAFATDCPIASKKCLWLNLKWANNSQPVSLFQM